MTSVCSLIYLDFLVIRIPARSPESNHGVISCSPRHAVTWHWSQWSLVQGGCGEQKEAGAEPPREDRTVGNLMTRPGKHTKSY